MQTLYSGPFSPCPCHVLGSEWLYQLDILTGKINSMQFLLVLKEISQHKGNVLLKSNLLFLVSQ